MSSDQEQMSMSVSKKSSSSLKPQSWFTMSYNRLKMARAVGDSCGLSLTFIAFGFGSYYFDEE